MLIRYGIIWVSNTKGAELMSISEELYTRMEATIMPLVEVKHKHHLSNWLCIASGILQSKSVALGQIAVHLPMEKQFLFVIRATTRTPLRRCNGKVSRLLRKALR